MTFYEKISQKIGELIVIKGKIWSHTSGFYGHNDDKKICVLLNAEKIDINYNFLKEKLEESKNFTTIQDGEIDYAASAKITYFFQDKVYQILTQQIDTALIDEESFS